MVIAIPGRAPVVIPETRNSRQMPASEVVYPKVPLVKAEAHVNLLVARGLKARIAGGLNSPGVGVRAGLVYLFGAS
jgi:hypothetical protein